MTIFDVIKDPYFTHKYVLERIVMHLLGFAREELIIHYDDLVDDETTLRIREMYDEYAIGKQPLEYILGYVEYGWLRFSVNKNTIIPRPETEYMIEAVREFFLTPDPSPWQEEGWPQGDLKKTILIDVGTGSWVLGLSILHSHGSQIEKAFLVDISEQALEVAKRNYKHLVADDKIDRKIEVQILKSNLLESALFSFPRREVVILANLPYIPDETFDTNPDQSIKFEPRVAFVGGDDGLDLYRVMFGQIRWMLNAECWMQMFLEMMTWQVDILRKEFDWLVFEEIKTFHFQIRIVKVYFK